jgi:hypothetical protein
MPTPGKSLTATISGTPKNKPAIYFGGSATYWLHLQSEFEIEKVKQNITIQLSTIQVPLSEPNQPVDKATPGDKKSKNGVKRRIMR